MASLIHTEEVEVANRLKLAVRRAIDGVLSKFCGLESGAIGIVDGVHHELTAIPVANPVCSMALVSFPSRC